MSNDIVNALWAVKVDGTAKSVLIVLASMADDAGRCWPSLEALSERTCFHRRSVIRAIQTLETAGYVVANRDNGRHTTYLVKTTPEPVTQSHPCQIVTRVTKSPDPCHKVTGPVTQSHTNHQESSRNINTQVIDAEPDIFDRVWEFYDHKVGRKPALKVWLTLKMKVGDPRLQKMRRAIELLKASRGWRDGYRPHLATWLNGERWNDELPPVTIIPIGGMEAANCSQKVTTD